DIARKFAVRARDLPLATDIARQLGTDFQVDELELRGTDIAAIASTARSTEERAQVLPKLLTLMEFAAQHDRYEIAISTSKVANGLATTLKDGGTMRMLRSRQLL